MSVRVRFRFVPLSPLVGGALLLVAVLAARDYGVEPEWYVVGATAATGVAAGMALHLHRVRRGWLRKRERIVVARILPWAVVGMLLSRSLPGLVQVGVLGFAAGLFLAMTVRPELPEREPAPRGLE